jgi:hypothetical protein
MRPHLFGPFRVIQRAKDVTYMLEWTEGGQGHGIYHASCIQRTWGPHVTTPTELPPLYERGRMLLTPEEILRVTREYRVRWRNWLIEDVMLENEHILQHLGLWLLEDKKSREGRIFMSPPF